MKHTITLGCLLAWLTPSLDAQTARIERATTQFDAAKAANKSKEFEAAMLHLQRARALLVDAKGGKALLDRVNKFAKRVDPRDAQRTKTVEKAARKLVKVGRRYADLGWRSLAMPLLEDANALAPEIARPALAALEASDADADASALAAMFRPGEFIWGKDEWEFDGPTLRSPAYDEGRQLRIGGRRMNFGDGDHTVAVEVMASGERDVRFVFAYRHVEEFLELRLHKAASGATRVELGQVLDGQPKVLSHAEINLTPEEKDGWIRMQVDTSAESIRATIGGHQPIKADAPARMIGFLGLMVVGREPDNTPVEFRNFRVEGSR